MGGLRIEGVDGEVPGWKDRIGRLQNLQKGQGTQYLPMRRLVLESRLMLWLGRCDEEGRRARPTLQSSYEPDGCPCRRSSET